MNAHNQDQVTLGETDTTEKVEGDSSRSVKLCNFRAAGRLSNENARALTAIHETCARNLAGALQDCVGAEVSVKLLSIEQESLRQYAANVPVFDYLVSFPLTTLSSSFLLEFDVNLVFPVIDLLLGGKGVKPEEPRELSEIEEEIMQDMMLVVARRTASTWGIDAELSAGDRIDWAGLPAVYPEREKVTLVRFTMDIAGINGEFQVVFPSSLVSVLIKLSAQGETQKKKTLRFFPKVGLRERMLECDIVVAADLPRLRVPVRDLIELRPGYVLKLHSPVRSPGMLTVEGMEIAEAVPVRNGARKAAQVGRRI